MVAVVVAAAALLAGFTVVGALGSRGYGASAWHGLALLVTAAVGGYAISRVVLLEGERSAIAIWFVGAIVVHDLVLFPVYAGADRLLWPALRRHRGPIPLVNHVRVPLLLSGLLLLVWAPLILGTPAETYRANTGLSISPFLGRWLWVSAALAGGSAVVYGLRVLWSRHSDTASSSPKG